MPRRRLNVPEHDLRRSWERRGTALRLPAHAARRSGLGGEYILYIDAVRGWTGLPIHCLHTDTLVLIVYDFTAVTMYTRVPCS